MLEAVKNNGFVLEWASEELQNDKEIVLEAVKNNGFALEYASKELKKDKEIVLQAVKIQNAIIYVSKELKNDKDFIIDCIIINKNIIYYYYNDLYLLIHYLQHDYNTKYIILDELFLDNIKYISKTSHFNNIFKFILNNHLQVFINNYNKFIPSIINNLDCIQLCQDYNIHIFNKDDVTNDGEYNFEIVEKEYKLKYKNKIILWY